RPARPGSVVFAIAHRTNTALHDEPFANYLGFDSGGLKIGIALRYGILEGLDAGFARLNGTNELFDTYELDARWRFLNERDHLVEGAARAGLSWFSESGNQAVDWFAQLMVSRVLFNRFMLTGSLLHHADSSNEIKTDRQSDPSTALGFGLDFRLTGAVAIELE